MNQRDIDAKCTCGRSLLPTHCVHCGSTNLYTVDRYSAIVDVPQDDGTSKRLKSPGFKCRRCACTFHQMMECAAPPTPSKTREKRSELATAISELGADRLGALRKLFEGKNLSRAPRR